MNASANDDARPIRSAQERDELLFEEATRLVRAEMVRRGLSFKQLAEAMAQREGEVESVQTLINKVNRGRFSFAFLLRVCRAMGIATLDVSESRRP